MNKKAEKIDKVIADSLYVMQFNHFPTLVNDFIQDFTHTHGVKCDTICLDAKAESQLVAFLVYRLMTDKLRVYPEEITSIKLSFGRNIFAVLMEDGIRHLDIEFLGMKLQFDCQKFDVV